MKRFKPTIVSGGQTGIDQAALDWAIERDWAHGGFCPKGRIAEDGIIPAKYRLKEATSSDYGDRTLLNVIHSDATLILSTLPLAEGTALTAKYARKEQKTLFVLSLGFAKGDLLPIHSFLANRDAYILNVAGPRLSHWPNGPAFAQDALSQICIPNKGLSWPKPKNKKP